MLIGRLRFSAVSKSSISNVLGNNVDWKTKYERIKKNREMKIDSKKSIECASEVQKFLKND